MKDAVAVEEFFGFGAEGAVDEQHRVDADVVGLVALEVADDLRGVVHVLPGAVFGIVPADASGLECSVLVASGRSV